MSTPNPEIEKIVEEFDRQFCYEESLGCDTNDTVRVCSGDTETLSWLRTTLTTFATAEREKVEDQLRDVYSALLEEFVYTGLATEEQWNETIAPAFCRLGNVVSGLSPESPTARVYKYPHKSTFPCAPHPDSRDGG